MHNKANNRVFTFSTDDQFDLLKIQRLVQQEVAERLRLKKLPHYHTNHFDAINKRIWKFHQKIERQSNTSATPMDHLPTVECVKINETTTNDTDE